MSRPTACAVVLSSGKWMPPYRRERPASSAASLNVAYVNVVGAGGIPVSTRPKFAGRTVENPKRSLPLNSWSTVALERENTECPEKYPGNGGVRLEPGLYGDHFSPGMSSVGRPGPPHA